MRTYCLYVCVCVCVCVCVPPPDMQQRCFTGPINSPKPEQSEICSCLEEGLQAIQSKRLILAWLEEVKRSARTTLSTRGAR